MSKETIKTVIEHIEQDREGGYRISNSDLRALKDFAEQVQALFDATDIVHFANHTMEHCVDGNGDWWIVRDNSGKTIATKSTALEAFTAIHQESGG